MLHRLRSAESILNPLHAPKSVSFALKPRKSDGSGVNRMLLVDLQQARVSQTFCRQEAAMQASGGAHGQAAV